MCVRQCPAIKLASHLFICEMSSVCPAQRHKPRPVGKSKPYSLQGSWGGRGQESNFPLHGLQPLRPSWNTGVSGLSKGTRLKQQASREFSCLSRVWVRRKYCLFRGIDLKTSQKKKIQGSPGKKCPFRFFTIRSKKGQTKAR